LDQSTSLQHKLNYHDWVTIFGRSLLPEQETRRDTFESQLEFIANAAESGMFSSDVHQTVMDIPPGSTHLPNHILHELNLGNKYAVLVGELRKGTVGYEEVKICSASLKFHFL